MKIKDFKDLFLIGEVAQKLGIHDQTIRTYERKGLIKPIRNDKNIRYFNQKDIMLITTIITLTQEYGINLTAVKMILALSKKLNLSYDDLLDYIHDHKHYFLG